MKISTQLLPLPQCFLMFGLVHPNIFGADRPLCSWQAETSQRHEELVDDPDPTSLRGGMVARWPWQSTNRLLVV